jgi:drug/metabolite transporter (DMT)-like permease
MGESPPPATTQGAMMLQYALLIAVPVLIAAGQVLFKLASAAVSGEFSIRALILNPYLATAIVLYGLATVMWMHVLSRIDLVRAYPFAALSFVLVPLLGHYLLGEQIGVPYVAGVALILLGVVLCQL